MNTDILAVISTRLGNADVANLSVAYSDLSMIKARKRDEYERILKRKMQNLWFGRLCSMLLVYRRTDFWEGRPLAITIGVRHRMASCFSEEWDVTVCGKHLHFATRILDDVISLTVNIHAPYHSCKEGDLVHFKFDIVHTSVPLHVDSYKPTGRLANLTIAMYEFLREKSDKQYGIVGPNSSTLWKQIIYLEDLLKVYEHHLGDGWIRMDDNYPTNIVGDHRYPNYYMSGFDWTEPPKEIDDARIRTMGLWSLYAETAHANGRIYISSCGGWIYDGARSSAYCGYRADLDRKLFHMLEELFEHSYQRYSKYEKKNAIAIKIGGKRHLFFSWNELSRTSGIRMEHLKKKMATKTDEGFYIDFDSQTFKRKKIIFEC